MSAGLAIAAAFALIVGVGFGIFHFGLLHNITRHFLAGRLPAVVGLQVGRLLLLGAVLATAAWFGALPLLACFAGVLIGRLIVLRRAKEEA